MLRLDLKPGESVKIGNVAVITLEEKSGKTARVAFQADRSVPITRVRAEAKSAKDPQTIFREFLAHLAGDVRIGRGAWIGIGSAVSQGVRIGQEALIGAGSAVPARSGRVSAPRDGGASPGPRAAAPAGRRAARSGRRAGTG